MHVVICDIKPNKGLIELFVIAEGRQILAVWMPNKYPSRARLEKIIKGKALDKHAFIALAEAIPAIVGEHIKGKPIKELLDLVGTSLYLDWSPEQCGKLADW